MKKLHFVLLALLLQSHCQAQQPDFMLMHPYPLEWDFVGSHAYEIVSDNEQENGCVFLAACSLYLNWYGYEDDMTIPAKILKLSPQGEIIGEMTIGEEGRRTVIDKILPDPSDAACCLAMGRIHNHNLHCDKPFLAKFDHTLNVLWQKEIDLPETYHKFFMGARCMMDSQGEIVFCTMPYTPEEVNYIIWGHRLFIRLSPEGEVLALAESPDLSQIVYAGVQGELFEYQDGSGDYGQIIGFGHSSTDKPKLLRMNRVFEIVSQKELPYNIQLNPGSLLFNYYEKASALPQPDGSVLISCMTLHNDGFNLQGDYAPVIAKMDDNCNMINFSFVAHESDSVHILADNQAMNGSNDAFYTCDYVLEIDSWGYYAINGIEVVKTDSDANTLWHRFFQDGEHVFLSSSVIKTHDEGCLVTGICFNNPPETTANVFLLKFFPDGTLSIPEMEAFVRPYAYWPNPAQDELHLQFSPDVTPIQIELYDLQGRLVKTQRNGLERLEMGNLPSGTYTMRVTLKDGKVFSDKVVKE